MLAGFAYYIYHTAERKGWFKTKVVYSTGLNNAAGLNPGDPVKLMGFTVGRLLEVIPNDPKDWYGVTVRFEVVEPNFGYIWLDSKVRVAPADFLGNRNLEIIKGSGDNSPTVIFADRKETKVLRRDLVVNNLNEIKATLEKSIAAEEPGFNPHAVAMEAGIQATNALNKLISENPSLFYTNLVSADPYWIEPLESPALTERLETIVNVLESAMPNILKENRASSADAAGPARAMVCPGGEPLA